jgi:two-component system, NarL family, sensor histidine kinase EvgS
MILSLPIRNSNAFNGEQYRCLAAGRDAVLIKPLTQQDLLTLVSEHIGH